ncbi:HD domain-containing protein [Micromonospora sp. WMMD729]|uniref:HD domain-containing protein n=1 Tax=Micromonospora sp. WMMD729 TaxID=3404127 RepID=UPI003BF611B8
MREKTSLLAGEIRRDLPEFTMHDIGHIDELWERAGLIGGDEVALNPAEAFTFGAAALVHDLAMSRAAYKIAGSNLRSHEQWADCLAANLRERNNRPPLPSELVNPPEDVAARTEAQLLRDLHADQAELLPEGKWESLDGSTIYLLGDADLRGAYGRLIGLLAASHHWMRDRLGRELSTPVGAPPFCPTGWRVDPLLIASLLRVADASHLDGSRTPAVLASTEHLPKESRSHWVFQSKLQRPYRDDDNLIYTAPSGFSFDEAESWWLAYEMLGSVDDEIRGVDKLLQSHNRQRLAVKHVAGVETPYTFSRLVPCIGWEPINAKVQVSDVASLVRRLGGKELYGNDSSHAVRELIMNACDAIKARAALLSYRGGTSSLSSKVLVRSMETEDGWWFEVADNGIGMSHDVLTGPLLDFGSSSWLAREVVRENQGLLASKFEPTGRFGIGFFSVFMLGNQVRVISRSHTASRESTAVLEFGDGLNARPIIRQATASELLDDPGTRVLVRLDPQMYNCEDLECEISNLTGRGIEFRDRSRSLLQTVKYLVPAPEVDIWVQGRTDLAPVLAMQGNDWTRIDGKTLLSRLIAGVDDFQELDGGGAYDEFSLIAEHYGPRLRLVGSNAESPLGRICALDDIGINFIGWGSGFASVVSAGPARTASGVTGVAGLLIGRPTRAARDFALPVLDKEFFEVWSTSEAERVGQDRIGRIPGKWCNYFALSMGSLGAHLGSFPHWNVGDGWLNDSELTEWLRARESVIVVHPVYLRTSLGMETAWATPLPNTVWFEGGGYRAIMGGPDGWPQNDGDRLAFDRSERFYSLLIEAWSLPETFLKEPPYRRESTAVSIYDGKVIYGDALTLNRHEIEAPRRSGE